VRTLLEKRNWGWIAAALLALGVVIALAASSYRAVSEQLTEAALSRRSSVAYLAATTLTEKFDRLIDIGVALATRVRFREMVEAGRWDEAIAILRAVPEDFPFIARIELLEPGGTLMADIPPSGARGSSFAAHEWYAGLSAGWRPHVSAVYRRSEPPQANVFAVAVPITGKQGGVTGILLMQLRLEHFFEWVGRVESPRGETLLVVDRAGKLAFRSERAVQGELADAREAPGVQAALAGRVGVEVAFSQLAGEEVTAAHVPAGGYGWAVVAQQPTRVAFGQRDLLLGLMSAAYGLAALLSVTGVFLAARIAGERRRMREEALVKAQLEERVAERTAQLEAVNRDLEAFSYSIAHDLRGPLRAIDGFSRILIDEHAPHLPAEAQRQLAVVRANAQQMGRLIDDLLAFAKLARQPVARGPVDMPALVQRSLEELSAEREGRAIDLAIGELPPAQGDAAMLKQVWLNLIGNAIKYTRGRPQASIEIGFGAAGGERAYYVRDNGVGFDMAYAHKLFGVFQRLHRAEDYEGTGVGLAIAAQIVQRHGGRIWAHAEPGRGATFHFTLEGTR
jgi:signal transduction histidine kinase